MSRFFMHAAHLIYLCTYMCVYNKRVHYILPKLRRIKIKAQQIFYLSEQCKMCTNASRLYEYLLKHDLNVKE